MSSLCLCPPLGPCHPPGKSQTVASRALCLSLPQITPHTALSSLMGLLTVSQTHAQYTSCLCTCSSFSLNHSCPRHALSLCHFPHALFKCHLPLNLPWSFCWKVTHTSTQDSQSPFPALFLSIARIIINMLCNLLHAYLPCSSLS